MTPIDKYIVSNRSDFITASKEQLERLHFLLLSMLKDIDQLCKKHGLTYFLTGGTAIGALRGHEFIPWDDDADIVMPRHDLEVFKSVFNLEMNVEKYVLDAPNYDHPASFCYPKVRLIGTKIRELVTDDDNCEVFVDIFPLENVSNNSFFRFLQTRLLTFLRDVSYDVFFASQFKKKFTKDGLRNCTFGTRVALYLGFFVGRVLSVIPLHKWVDFYDRIARSSKKTEFVSIPTGMHGPKKETYDRQTYYPARYEYFEGYLFPLPNRIERILENFYGDFMTPPPPEKRARHFYVELDLGGL